MVRQNYSEAVVADIRVAVLFGLSIWFFFVVVSSFFVFPVSSGCFFLFCVVLGNLVFWVFCLLGGIGYSDFGFRSLNSVGFVWFWLRMRSFVESSQERFACSVESFCCFFWG